MGSYESFQSLFSGCRDVDLHRHHDLHRELMARDLIAFKDGVWQVFDLSAGPKGH